MLPQSMPFFSAAADFPDVTDTAREFLERCLARLEAFEPAVDLQHQPAGVNVSTKADEYR